MSPFVQTVLSNAKIVSTRKYEINKQTKVPVQSKINFLGDVILRINPFYQINFLQRGV